MVSNISFSFKPRLLNTVRIILTTSDISFFINSGVNSFNQNLIFLTYALITPAKAPKAIPIPDIIPPRENPSLISSFNDGFALVLFSMPSKALSILSLDFAVSALSSLVLVGIAKNLSLISIKDSKIALAIR